MAWTGVAEPDLRSLASLASLLANRLAVANLVLWLSFCFACLFVFKTASQWTGSGQQTNAAKGRKGALLSGAGVCWRGFSMRWLTLAAAAAALACVWLNTLDSFLRPSSGMSIYFCLPVGPRRETKPICWRHISSSSNFPPRQGLFCVFVPSTVLDGVFSRVSYVAPERLFVFCFGRFLPCDELSPSERRK